MASTPTTVRAAAIQIAPDFERPEGTLERVCGAIDAAAVALDRIVAGLEDAFSAR